MSSKVRCAVIGLGIMGKEGGSVLSLIDEVEIVALAEPIEATMKEALNEFKGATPYSDYNEMLKKERLSLIHI